MFDLEPMRGTEYATKEDCLAAFYSGRAFLYHPFEEPVREITIETFKGGDSIQFRHHDFSHWFRLYLTHCVVEPHVNDCLRCGGRGFVPRFFNRRYAYYDKKRSPFWQASRNLYTGSSGQA